ncbi:MAG: GAF domain-containing sensor histidine kinase [Chloroflexi bacterium]|nr:GAF domain-containing sensor histidine kinase [Chloroflexota bacterium]
MMSETESTRVQRLERILEITRELTSTVALERLLHKIVDVAAEVTGSEAASILLLDIRSGELRFRAESGDPSGLLNIPVPVDDSIAGAVFISGEPCVISDTCADPRHYDAVGQQIGRQTCSLLAVPLQIKERRIGVLETINKCEGDTFDQDDVEILTALAAQAAVAIETARLVEAMREAYERLGKLDQLKSDFIAIASHELRTPLSLILLYASVLQEQLGEEAGPQLDAVLRAATHLKDIIGTMLNLRFLETGRLDVLSTCFDLRDVVQEACADNESMAETNDLALRTDLPGDELSIQADREKIRVVLDNLISNAIKFTPSGGQVQIALCSRDDEVEIVVSDTGIGIPQGELERIFDRFYQVEDHMIRRHGGMGLGLSIVKGLVELHGGRVWAESVPDQGSRFVVVLPAQRENAGRRD